MKKGAAGWRLWSLRTCCAFCCDDHHHVFVQNSGNVGRFSNLGGHVMHDTGVPFDVWPFQWTTFVIISSNASLAIKSQICDASSWLCWQKTFWLKWDIFSSPWYSGWAKSRVEVRYLLSSFGNRQQPPSRQIVPQGGLVRYGERQALKFQRRQSHASGK